MKTNINPALGSVMFPSGLRLLATAENLHASRCRCLRSNEEKSLAYGPRFATLLRVGSLGVLGGQIFRVGRIREAINNSHNLLLVRNWILGSLARTGSPRSPLCACETSDTNCAQENNNFSVPLNALLTECLATMAHSIIF